MADNKILRPPMQLTDLTKADQLKELNDFLKDIWRYANNGVNQTLTFSTASGKVATIIFQNGSAVDATITP